MFPIHFPIRPEDVQVVPDSVPDRAKRTPLGVPRRSQGNRGPSDGVCFGPMAIAGRRRSPSRGRHDVRRRIWRPSRRKPTIPTTASGRPIKPTMSHPPAIVTATDIHRLQLHELSKVGCAAKDSAERAEEQLAAMKSRWRDG